MTVDSSPKPVDAVLSQDETPEPLPTAESTYPARDNSLVPAQGSQPVAAAGASYTAVLIALVLLGAAFVLIRDALIDLGWISGSVWTPPAVDWVDGLTYQSWMLAAGIGCVVLGLIFVYLALKPRRKTAVPLEIPTSAYVSPSDVARIASATAETVSGVQTASSEASRKKVKVRVTYTGSDPVDNAVSDAVKSALNPLLKTPKVVVRSKVGVEQ